MQYYVVPQTWICPVQLTGAKGFFGAHTGTSTMRVWSWAEPPAAHITTSDLSIATIRTDEWLVNLPSGEQWFAPAQSPDNEITGAARVRNELWFAWMEARRVPDHPEARAYPYPHINTAVVSATSLTLCNRSGSGAAAALMAGRPSRPTTATWRSRACTAAKTWEGSFVSASLPLHAIFSWYRRAIVEARAGTT